MTYEIKIGSPAHKAGMVIGKQYALRVKEGDLYPGDLVTFVRDDGSTCPRFEAKGLNDGWDFIDLEDLVIPAPSANTPAEKAGLVIGQKYKVTAGFNGSSRHDGYHNFDKDDIVTFNRDDHSDNPQFRRVRDGNTQYIHVTDVVLYKETPAEQAGYKIGDKFTVIPNSRGFFKDGATVTLTRDDNTSVPEFTGPDKDTGKERKGYAALKDVTPFVEPVVKKTPVQEAGYILGQKFVVLHPTHGYFEPGTTITLIRDDGTNIPEFSGKGSRGTVINGFIRLDAIATVETEVPAAPSMKVDFNTVLTFTKVLTPAQITAIKAIADKA